jgi:hypothetical protein
MKKKYINPVTIFISLFIVSCQKESVKAPDFEVSVPAFTYKVGDTVRFAVSGNADYIIFYSGEKRHEYKHRGRTSLPGAQLFLSFFSRVQNGTQADQLRVMISSDFPGVYDTTSIKNASWSDITNDFALATENTAVTSGNVDITSEIPEGKPFYIAYKYITSDQNVNGKQRNWFITSFNLTSQSSIGEVTLGDQSAAAFLIVSFGAKEAGRSTLTSSQITFRGNAADLASYTEDWAVTKSFDAFSVLPDSGVPVKNFSDNPISGYAYSFKDPGTYTVSFVARNGNAHGLKEEVKELTITVEP